MNALFTSEGLEKANKELKSMKFDEFPKFDYDKLIHYFNDSDFFLFDEEHTDTDAVKEKFHFINNPDRVIFFYFILAQTDKIEQNNIDLYLALYSNKIGIIYDLILGNDFLSDLFNDLFSDFCLVPLLKRDQRNLSYLIDLSKNYFLNSSCIAYAYNYDCFKKVVIENIINQIDQKYKTLRFSKDLYFQTMIKLIVYYVPLIPIITDDLQLKPANNDKSNSLPVFSRNDFDDILPNGNNSFEISNILLYRKSFELYTVNTIKDEYREKFTIQKNFFRKVYKKGDIPFIIPCYGTIENRAYRGYESPKGLLFKFICNGKITEFKGKGNAKVKYWDNTTKSLNIFRLLVSITTMHEFGYYHRNVKPDHIFLDNENKIYFGGMATICDLNNVENDSIGSEMYSSPEQYKCNISSPHSDIYSFGINIMYIINGGNISNNAKYFEQNEKLKLLLDECTNGNPESRPDAFILLTQMYENFLFLPKTNHVLIDEIFYSIYRQYLTTSFVDGKYLSEWTKSVDSSHFKSKIYEDLKDMFIIKFFCTELEAKLNRATSNNNLFLIEYDKLDIFYVNFFANELGNQYLKEKTDELIDSTSTAYQIINKLMLYNNLYNEVDESGKDYIIRLYSDEIDNFAKNFDECILLASEFNLSPEFILRSIIEEKQLNLNSAHNTVSYILSIGSEYAKIEIIVELLKHFKEISSSDINKLIELYGPEIAKSLNNSKIAHDNDELLNDINEKLEKCLMEMSKIETDVDNEILDDTYIRDHKDFFKKVDKIDEVEVNIELLTKNLQNDSISENDSIPDK